MILHENCLLADNFYEISYLIFSKIRKDVAKFVVCCSRDCRFKGLRSVDELQFETKSKGAKSKLKLNSFLASGNFCHLLITFSNILDPDQV